MARAIALSPIPDAIVGDSVVFTAHVQFLGTDLPSGPDSSVVSFTISPNDSANTIATNFATAIKNEAARLQYAMPNNSILMPAFVKV
jgi:hypothetical protein